MKFVHSLFFTSVALLWACSSEDVPNETPPPTADDTVAAYLYLGACSPSQCEGLPVPEIGCPDGQPTYVCREATSGCAIDVQCNPEQDPNTAVSFASCELSECGAKPSPPSAACPEGYAWGEPQCGSLNDSACEWAQGCFAKPSDVPCDDEACGPKPEIAFVCDDGSHAELVCRKVGQTCQWQDPPCD